MAHTITRAGFTMMAAAGNQGGSAGKAAAVAAPAGDQAAGAAAGAQGDQAAAGETTVDDGGDASGAGDGSQEGDQAGKAGAPGDQAEGKGGAAAVDGKAGAEKGAAKVAAKGAEPAGDKGPASKTAVTVPEKYDLQPAEGREVYATDRLIERFGKLAKAQGLTQEQAQQRFDAVTDELHEQAENWRKETETDPEIGGDNFAQSVALGRAVVNRIRPDGHPRREAFLQLLNANGVGNQVEVVAFLADLGRMMGEDAGASGSPGGAPSKSDDASGFYDHPTSRKADEEGKAQWGRT